MYEFKKIFIIGLARSGYECAKLLAKNNKITLVDENKEDIHIEELKNSGVDVIIAPKEEQSDFLDSSFDVVIRNPGVPLDSRCVLKARELNIPITGDVDIAYNLLPKDIKIIAITGSNGKTTTTTMIYEILKSASLPVHLGGNIGYPVTSLVNKVKEKDILVLEISDHQLVNMQDFKSDISILTNIVESHIDFHGSYEAYKKTKKKIFNNHNESSIAIINASNQESMDLTSDIPSHKIYFSTKKESNIYLKDESIYYDNELLINTNDIKLVGNHNYENIMCTLAVCKELKVDMNIMREFLKNFSGVEHRLEYVGQIVGIIYYNDAKSTNTAATLTALSSFKKPIHLLLGGLDRGHSFDEIAKYKNNIQKIYAYGEVKDRIKNFANEFNIECISLDNLKEATIAASKHAKAGEVVLLSPACASWDQYEKFEDRGREFKDTINDICQ